MANAQVAAPVVAGVAAKKGIHFRPLIEGIEELTQQVEAKIDALRRKGEEGGDKEISIADMFDLQLTMNRLQQFSEMTTSVLSSMNGSINSMARNIK